MKEPVALLIGFGPFPGAPVNPSASLVNALGRIRRPAWSDVKILTHVLPADYAEVERELPSLIKKFDPAIVLMFGLATRAKKLRVESRAVNARSLIHPDASSRTPVQNALSPRGPAVLKSSAPIGALAAAARSAGVNANVSINAGRYVCNASLYACLDLRRETGRPPLVAFVHIPWPRRVMRADRVQNRALPTARQLEKAGAAILSALIAVARRR